MTAINLAQKLALFSEHWSPKTVTEFNGHDIMVVKFQGEYAWHQHDDTDDFFLVLEGEIDIELRDRTITLQRGEMFVVPKGVEHRPVAREEAPPDGVEQGNEHEGGRDEAAGAQHDLQGLVAGAQKRRVGPVGDHQVEAAHLASTPVRACLSSTNWSTA